jgi:hypothetical protein
MRLNQPVDLSSRKVQEELSSSALLAFFRLTDLWNLRDQDARGLLGGISNGAYYSLKRRPAKTLDQDTPHPHLTAAGNFQGAEYPVQQEAGGRLGAAAQPQSHVWRRVRRCFR